MLDWRWHLEYNLVLDYPWAQNRKSDFLKEVIANKYTQTTLTTSKECNATLKEQYDRGHKEDRTYPQSGENYDTTFEEKESIWARNQLILVQDQMGRLTE